MASYYIASHQPPLVAAVQLDSMDTFVPLKPDTYASSSISLAERTPTPLNDAQMARLMEQGFTRGEWNRQD
jgi:hypothetical protein